MSETPIEDPNLEEIRHRTLEGDWSGETTKITDEVLTGKQMAKALTKQGSDPGFFKLTARGADTE